MTERQKTFFGVIAGLLPLVFAIPLELTGRLERFENTLIDIRYALFNPQHDHSDDVVILDLDEQTLNAYKNEPGFGRWPWKRDNRGPILKYLYSGTVETSKGKTRDIPGWSGPPRAVLFDILFTESSPNDNNLAAATASVPVLVHSLHMRNDEEVIEEPLPEWIASKAYAVEYVDGYTPDHYNVVQYPAVKIGQNAGMIGCVTYRSDPDNISRLASPAFTFQGSTYLSLPLMGYLMTYDAGIANIKMSGDELTIEGSRNGQPKKVSVPLENGKLRLHYYPAGIYDATARKSLHRVSLSGVIDSIRAMAKEEDKKGRKLKVDPGQFNGKIVALATSATATFDEKLTPYGPHPGYVLHATILSNLLNEHFLYRVPHYWGWVAAMLLVSASGFLVLRFHRMAIRVMVPIFLFLLCGAGASAAFYRDYAFYFAPLPITFIPSFLGMISVLSYFEGAEKRRFKGAMSKYLSPDVLEEVMKKGELKAEVGERKVLTVLFSDVRGFTTISENMDAGDVVHILNQYFSRMVRIIFDNKGTLDKFIGDAIMAFWGAPVPRADHALLAARSAMAMSASLKELNEQFMKEGLEPLAIGVGINTGEMIVGNIGSDQRLDYTIIGDNVNLGSRLESLTKQYGVEVLIAESTMKEIVHEIPCRLLDLVAVKGKAIPVPIYEPLSEKAYSGMEYHEVADQFQLAFDLYQDRKWQESIAIYERLDQARGGKDKLAKMMTERCRYYEANPPAPDWDGSFVMKTK